MNPERRSFGHHSNNHAGGIEYEVGFGFGPMPGFTMKNQLADYLKSKGHDVIDLGVHNEDSVDFPDKAKRSRYRPCRKERPKEASCFAVAASAQVSR